MRTTDAARIRTILILLLVSFCGTQAWASGSSVRRSVPPAYSAIAAEYGIPPKFFYAHMLVESGRPYNGQVLPWPWTLNIHGKAHYYKSRQRAYEALVRELSRGNRDVAIGLGQIYWRYNAKVVRNDPWLALDPYYNLRSAAYIFATSWKQTNSIEAAYERYYCGKCTNKAAGRRYAERVERWVKRLR